jgi:LacI family transcriptional regulator
MGKLLMNNNSSTRPNKAANLEDIAAKAGVSRSTVSRVINNEPYVSPKTRAKVEAVIKEEDFSPNPAARTLVTQRTKAIGIVIPHILNAISSDDAYFSTLLRGINAVTTQRDHATLLWLEQSGDDEERFRRRILQNRMMDGLIVASAAATDPIFAHLIEAGRHFVTVERPTQFAEHTNYVTVDNVTAAQTAVEHLIQHGRRRIATITGNLYISDGGDRLTGYRNALASAGINYNANLVIPAQFNRGQGYAGMKQLIGQQFDAIFAANDAIALGVMQAANEIGMRIPDDFALVGFDDLNIAAQLTPPLTTIRQPVFEKGACAANLLIDLIEEKVKTPQKILLQTELVIRDSCGAKAKDVK